MYVKLEQDGDVISGINGQLKHPFDPPSTIRAISDRTLRGLIKGKWYPGSRTNMIVFERQAGTSERGSAPARTWAIFTALIAADGRSAVGKIVNHGGYYGTFFMIKREALKDYLPLLEEEGRKAYEAKRLWESSNWKRASRQNSFISPCSSGGDRTRTRTATFRMTSSRTRTGAGPISMEMSS